jgi:hypothetical protein
MPADAVDHPRHVGRAAVPLRRRARDALLAGAPEGRGQGAGLHRITVPAVIIIGVTADRSLDVAVRELRADQGMGETDRGAGLVLEDALAALQPHLTGVIAEEPESTGHRRVARQAGPAGFEGALRGVPLPQPHHGREGDRPARVADRHVGRDAAQLEHVLEAQVGAAFARAAAGGQHVDQAVSVAFEPATQFGRGEDGAIGGGVVGVAVGAVPGQGRRRRFCSISRPPGVAIVDVQGRVHQQGRARIHGQHGVAQAVARPVAHRISRLADRRYDALELGIQEDRLGPGRHR